MSRVNLLYTATALGTSTATGRKFFVPAQFRDGAARAVVFVNSGTATAKLMGSVTPGGTYVQLGTNFTTSATQFLQLTPYLRVDISGASGTPTLSLNVDALCHSLDDVASISVSPTTASLDLSALDTQQLTVAYANGQAEAVSAVSGATVTYASSDTAKATVSATGLITPAAVGTASITATYTAFHGEVLGTASCAVTVVA